MVSTNSLVYLFHDVVCLFNTQAPQIWMGEASFVQDIFYQDEPHCLDLQLSRGLPLVWQDAILQIQGYQCGLVNFSTYLLHVIRIY